MTQRLTHSRLHLRTFMMIIVAALSSFCSLSIQAQNITKIVHNPTHFDTIDVNGRIQLYINQDAATRPHISVTGSQTNLDRIAIDISHHTLHLFIPGTHDNATSPLLTVHINHPGLRGINLAGRSQVMAHFSRQSTPLSLRLRNDSQITVNGMVNLRQLTQSNHSNSQIIFTNSPTLNVDLRGHARAEIAGRSQSFYARSSTAAKLNARYLRAEQAWVQNHGHSQTLVSPLQQLSAFGNDYAQIYYYANQPLTSLTQYTNDHANILAMP